MLGSIRGTYRDMVYSTMIQLSDLEPSVGTEDTDLMLIDRGLRGILESVFQARDLWTCI